MLLSLVVSVLSARYLGPENYGALNYSASFVAFFSSIASLGMESVIIKRIIGTPEQEGGYLGGCFILRLISSAFSSVTIVLLVFVLNPGDKSKILLATLQSLQLIFQAGNILDCWFQRYLKSKYISIGKIIACLIVSVYKVTLIVTGKSVEWFAFSNSLSSLIISVLLVVFYRRNKGPKLRINISLGKDVLQDSYHYVLSGMMVAIYGQMDKIMIGKMMTDVDVGLYSTATAISGMWIFVPMAIIQSFRPSIIEMHRTGHLDLYKKKLLQLYSIIIWLCVIVSVCVCIFAPLAIRILYGSAYIGAITSLRISIWLETFAMIGTARGIWILCENKSRYVKYYLMIGCCVNLALNAILIPLWGIEGAAVATLVTQICTSLVAPLLFKATREHTRLVWEAFSFRWYFEK